MVASSLHVLICIFLWGTFLYTPKYVDLRARRHGAGQRELEEAGQEGSGGARCPHGDHREHEGAMEEDMDEDMVEVEVEGPPSDNETLTSSKRSHSKPEHARGPTRQAKQARKALIHKGILSKEEAESLSPVEVLDMVKKHRQGSSMLSEVLLQQLEENKKENLLARLFGGHTEMPEMEVPKITDQQVREADRVLLAGRSALSARRCWTPRAS